jgi:hypothetical protein
MARLLYRPKAFKQPKPAEKKSAHRMHSHHIRSINVHRIGSIDRITALQISTSFNITAITLSSQLIPRIVRLHAPDPVVTITKLMESIWSKLFTEIVKYIGP